MKLTPIELLAIDTAIRRSTPAELRALKAAARRGPFLLAERGPGRLAIRFGDEATGLVLRLTWPIH